MKREEKLQGEGMEEGEKRATTKPWQKPRVLPDRTVTAEKGQRKGQRSQKTSRTPERNASRRKKGSGGEKGKKAERQEGGGGGEGAPEEHE